jgi:hypothetical protein
MVWAKADSPKMVSAGPIGGGKLIGDGSVGGGKLIGHKLNIGGAKLIGQHSINLWSLENHSGVIFTICELEFIRLPTNPLKAPLRHDLVHMNSSDFSRASIAVADWASRLRWSS